MDIGLGVPDALSKLRLDRARADAKQGVDRAQAELATGEAADVVKATGGDPGRLFSLDRALATIESRGRMMDLAATRASATQVALGAVQGAVGQLGVDLLSTITIGDNPAARLSARDAGAALAQVTTTLNGSISGRALFAGDGDGPALAPAATLIEDVQAILLDPLNVTLADVDAALDLYFSDTAGPPAVNFQNRIFGGGAGDAPPVELGEGDRLSYAIRADAPPLKALMRNLALAAAAEGLPDAANAPPGAGIDPARRLELLRVAGAGLIGAGDAIETDLRAPLGFAERRIEQAQTRAGFERDALTIARNDLVGVDLEQAATQLSERLARLEAIFAVTARVSQLSLLNFLR